MIQIKIDHVGTITPPTSDLHLDANNLARDPRGTIWLNTTTTDPGLFKTSDGGASWTSVKVRLPDVPPNQHIAGFTVTRDAHLWAVHQTLPTDGGSTYDPAAYVSHSSDDGQSWHTTPLDNPNFAPGAPQDPYTKIQVAWCHPNFLERPDGSLMFSASMRYDDWDDYQQEDQTRPGIRDVMVRTKDGGKTWGDPTIVHQHATETAYAADPNGPDRILATTRIQRFALPGENEEEIRRTTTGVPYPPGGFLYKNGLLLESTDGGRSFREIEGGLTWFGAYRHALVWTEENIVVSLCATGQAPGKDQFIQQKIARVSLDGGRTWVDDSNAGTPYFNQAKRYFVIPEHPPEHLYKVSATPTIAISPDRFLTVYRFKGEGSLKSLFWHLEVAPCR